MQSNSISTLIILSCSLLLLIIPNGVSSASNRVAKRIGDRRFLDSPPVDNNFRYENLPLDKQRQLDETITKLKAGFGDLIDSYTKVLNGNMVQKNSQESIELQQIIDDLTILQTSNDIPIDILLESSKKAISQQVSLLSRVSVKMMKTYDWDAVYSMRDNLLWNFIASGDVSGREAELFSNNDESWAKELFTLWDAIYNSSTDQ